MSSQISASPLADVFARLKAQQVLYLDRAGALRGDAMWIEGLSVASSVATLGFAAYDAHKDNILAAALTAGIANAANTRLTPGSAEAFYMRGVTALTCVNNASRELYYVGGGDVFSMPSGATLKYQEVRENLMAKRAEATAFIEEGSRALSKALAAAKAPSNQAALNTLRAAADKAANAQSAKLAAALSRAEAADSKLQLGLTAQRKLVPTMNKAMEDLHVLVTKRQTPDLKSLLDTISKVEIPKPAPPSTTGTSTATKDANKLFVSQALGGSEIAASSDELASALHALVREVEDMAPENDEAAIKRISGCVITFGASAG